MKIAANIHNICCTKNIKYNPQSTVISTFDRLNLLFLLFNDIFVSIPVATIQPIIQSVFFNIHPLNII